MTSLFWRQSIVDRTTHLRRLSLWELVQLFYFPTQQQSNTGVALMQWLNSTDKTAEPLLRFNYQAIYETKDLIGHDQFWPAVYKLILRGELVTLVQLLTQAKARILEHTHDEGLLLLIGVFLKAATDCSLAKANAKDEQAHIPQQTLRSDVSHFIATYPSLSNIGQCILEGMAVLAGDEKVTARLCETPLEGFIAYVYYGSSNATCSEIHALADQWWSSSDSASMESTSLDSTQAVVRGNVQAMLEDQCLGVWGRAHLTDLLVMAGHHGLKEARQTHVLAYCAVLLQHGLWSYAMDYMSTCGEEGKAMMRKTPRQVPISDESTAKALLKYCRRNAMEEENTWIYKTLGLLLKESNALSSALYYFDLAGDAEAVECVFETAIQHYAATDPTLWFTPVDYKTLQTQLEALAHDDDLTGYSLVGAALAKHTAFETTLVRDTFFELFLLVFQRSPLK
ncbi:nucleoporin Nup85-like protein [Spinellus fusiger]|nr:nucleoporin Nup85-like protein [Spinellus fusiger]